MNKISKLDICSITLKFRKIMLKQKSNIFVPTLPRWLKARFCWLGYSFFQKVVTFARDFTKKVIVESLNSACFTVYFFRKFWRKFYQGNIVLILLQIDTFHQIDVSSIIRSNNFVVFWELFRNLVKGNLLTYYHLLF